jgi:hypothetical protein
VDAKLLQAVDQLQAIVGQVKEGLRTVEARVAWGSLTQTDRELVLDMLGDLCEDLADVGHLVGAPPDTAMVEGKPTGRKLHRRRKRLAQTTRDAGGRG